MNVPPTNRPSVQTTVCKLCSKLMLLVFKCFEEMYFHLFSSILNIAINRRSMRMNRTIEAVFFLQKQYYENNNTKTAKHSIISKIFKTPVHYGHRLKQTYLILFQFSDQNLNLMKKTKFRHY